MNWLIEQDVYPHNERRLSDAVVKSGHTVHLVEVDSLTDFGGLVRSLTPTLNETIVYGSIQFAQRLKGVLDLVDGPRQLPKGLFYDIDRFRCVMYYPFLYEHLVNGDRYSFLPLGDLDRQADFLFDELADGDDQIFVRPDAGNKLFTGQIVNRNTLYDDLDLIRFYDPPISTMCVISTVKEIKAEYRFLVQFDRVITGAQYIEQGQHYDDLPLLDFSSDPYQFAQGMAEYISEKGARPDPLYMLDVAEMDDGSFKIMELNSFSAADLYGMDVNKVVESVNETMEMI